MITLALTILVGVLYRLGGWQYGNKLYRRLGVPLFVAIQLARIGTPLSSWHIYATFVLMIPAIGTYWDWLFGYDNYYAHALGVGLSLAPVAYATGHLPQLIPVVILLTLWSGIWSKILVWDIAEEFGRLLPLVFLVKWLV